MKPARPCPECDSTDLYETRKDVFAGGGGDQWTDLLPGLGGLLTPGRLSVLVCSDCGWMRLHASEEACAMLRKSSEWSRVVVEDAPGPPTSGCD